MFGGQGKKFTLLLRFFGLFSLNQTLNPAIFAANLAIPFSKAGDWLRLFSLILYLHCLWG
jgi:hypothetical protein